MPYLEITTMIGCTLHCKICPQDLLIKAYRKRIAQQTKKKNTKPLKQIISGFFADTCKCNNTDYYLTLFNFKKIVNKLPGYVKLSFAGMSEPWLNPNCTRMLAYALEKSFKISIYSTLVGMTARDAEAVCNLLRLHANQMVNVVVHLPDSLGHMQNWKITDDYKQALGYFITLQNEKILPHISMMTMNTEGDLHPDLNYLGWKIPGFRPSSRSGNVTLLKTQQFAYVEPVTCCISPFYDLNVLLPNGDVALCCHDYGLRHIIGNLLNDDYFDILSKHELYRLNMQYGSDKSLCKKCHRAIPYCLNIKNDWIPCEKS